MSRRRVEAVRIGLALLGLVLLQASLLCWRAGRAEVINADGLRYVAQARAMASGHWDRGLRIAVDQPAYPASIAVVHRLLRLDETPEAWHRAAQSASVLAGIALIIPLFGMARTILGRGPSMLGCLLVIGSPFASVVMADSLSEPTFLLGWLCGLYAASRYLERGDLVWLTWAILASTFGFLVRPEAALLPMSLGLFLVVSVGRRRLRFESRRWWSGLAVLVLGPVLLLGPFVLLKGGLTSKPAVARLLGLAEASPGEAVEREQPLDPEATPLQIHRDAALDVIDALSDGVSLPLLLLAGLGILWTIEDRRRRAGMGVGVAPDKHDDGAAVTDVVAARRRLWLAITLVLSMLALVRLHATGGYCSPRHTLIPGILVILGAAWTIGRLAARFGSGRSERRVRWFIGALLVAWLTWQARTWVAPIGHIHLGYKQAGLWLAERDLDDRPILDVTGWGQYYSGRPGYTFANLHEAILVERPRWLIVRRAHLAGPWGYCQHLRALVGARRPIRAFPELDPSTDDRSRPGRASTATVWVFDLDGPESDVDWRAPEFAYRGSSRSTR